MEEKTKKAFEESIEEAQKEFEFEFGKEYSLSEIVGEVDTNDYCKRCNKVLISGCPCCETEEDKIYYRDCQQTIKEEQEEAARVKKENFLRSLEDFSLQERIKRLERWAYDRGASEI